MQSLNLRGDPSGPEEPAAPPSEEPLGLAPIRRWLRKPRPRLYRLWLWAPLTANAVRKAFVWLRVHGPPAMRRAARFAWKAVVAVQALRHVARRIGEWFRARFPPGSRGHEFGAQLLASSRALGRAVKALLALGGGLDRVTDLLPAAEAETEPSRPAVRSAPPPVRKPPRRQVAAATGGAPQTNDPQSSPGPPKGARAEALAQLSNGLRLRIRTLGQRPRRGALRPAIWRILRERGATTSERLGLLLNMDPANLTKRHLSPMVAEGSLERTVPDRITHPEQAYRATHIPPG